MSNQAFSTVSVIGGGAWGTALANLIAQNGVNTTIWAREPAVIEGINTANENTEFLKGFSLAPDLHATDDLAEAAKADAIVFVVPAQFARQVMEPLALQTREGTPVVLCSKGIEASTGLLMTEVLEQAWPGAIGSVLSGPSFAVDVARAKPTAVTLACPPDHADIGRQWIATLGAPHFRPYLSDDPIGAELGGAIKNVLAIATGVVAGRGFGESAKAALIARGFVEAQRLATALGRSDTAMAGLSGLGDLVLTASSPQSRNMSLGMELGKGRSLQEVLGERNTVSEGVATAAVVVKKAKEAGVEMPICAAVAALTTNQKTVDEVIQELMSRPFKSEHAR